MNDANQTRSDGTNPPTGRHLEVSLTDVPRGQQAVSLMAQLRSAVRAGSLPPDTQLPASRTLAADLSVSRGVVVRAYEQLTAEGYLVARRGAGTRVAHLRRPSQRVPSPVTRPVSNPGLPPGALFPRTAWLRAAAQALDQLPDAELGYGDPAGLAALRRELSVYLGRVRALVAPPDRIVVVNGFAQASRLLAEVLIARGIDRIGVEDPGSTGLRDQLERAGLHCSPVTVDADGLDVDDLHRQGLRAVVVTPAHQFPTGVVMAAERRHALLEWARDVDGIVLEDDYDAEYRYDRSPVGALQGLDPDVVAYGGSVSKTLAPAIRLGWLILPDHLVVPVADAKYAADLSTGSLDQATLAQLLASGQMDLHIRRTAAHYRQRRDRLVTELAGNLPDWSVSGTAAGLHLLAHPPDDADERALATLAQSCGLDARPLSAYRIRPDPQPSLVIGYAHRSSDAIARAIRELARHLRTTPSARRAERPNS